MTNKQADNLQYGDAVSYPEWQGNKVVIFATTVISFRELPDGETGYVLGTGITLRAASIHPTRREALQAACDMACERINLLEAELDRLRDERSKA